MPTEPLTSLEAIRRYIRDQRAPWQNDREDSVKQRNQTRAKKKAERMEAAGQLSLFDQPARRE